MAPPTPYQDPDPRSASESRPAPAPAQAPAPPSPSPTPAQPPGGDGAVPFREALRGWAEVALHSFGGPAGQIGVMHRVFVEQRRWIDDRHFLHAMSFTMLLPGPEAMQLATYVGWLQHGTRGALVAGGLFVLPGFLAILALSLLYAAHQDAPALAALFFGLKAAVLAVVVEAVVRLGRRALRHAALAGIATVAFVGIFLFEVPFPAILAGAALAGLLGHRLRPGSFALRGAGGGEGPRAPSARAPPPPSARATARVAAVWLAVWLLPLAALAALAGPAHVLTQVGVFFSQVAVVTFGGAYAVLAYVAQQAVDVHGWLLPGEMLDGLGMAETTPGPLIQVVQFVAFLAGFRAQSGLDPWHAAVLASAVATHATFAPCFLWVLIGAPYVAHTRGWPRLGAAMAGITAAVVGVIANLAAWFGLHTLFTTLHAQRALGMRLLLPDPATLDVAALALAAGALVALLGLRWGMLRTLAAFTLLGMAHQLLLVPLLTP